MLNSTSVKSRFLVSVGANLVRSIMGFISGLLVARGLGPSNYGDMAFLLGSFSAILSLLDLGTSNAFYTFLSRRARGTKFFLVYFSWILLQLLFTFLLVTFLMPDQLFQKIWLGHKREIVLFALIVVFMQQQVWQTINQIGESIRKTAKMQLLNLLVAFTYLLGVVLMTTFVSMSLGHIFTLMTIQYGVVAFIAYWFLDGKQLVKPENIPLKNLIQEYWQFCRPLAMLSLVVFLYNFADKWLLQNYGGSIQQGYFQISNQFATVSLLATTSILSVFWKEIAEASEKDDHARVEMLYRKVSRSLVLFGAIISGLLIPWAEQIVTIFMGASYAPAWPILALMLLYPIHQSMGQIGGTMLLAKGQTTIHMFISVGSMLVSMPIAYLLLTSATHGGWDLGAMGIAIKSVLLGVISVNIQSWVIARICGWKFDWIFQVVGIPLMILIGYGVKFLMGLVWDLGNMSVSNLVMPVVINCVLYVFLVCWLIWVLPWLAGLEKLDISNFVKMLRSRMVAAICHSNR